MASRQTINRNTQCNLWAAGVSGIAVIAAPAWVIHGQSPNSLHCWASLMNWRLKPRAVIGPRRALSLACSMAVVSSSQTRPSLLLLGPLCPPSRCLWSCQRRLRPCRVSSSLIFRQRTVSSPATPPVPVPVPRARNRPDPPPTSILEATTSTLATTAILGSPSERSETTTPACSCRDDCAGGRAHT